MSVIPFRRRPAAPEPGPETQWGSGEAFCISCDHQWVAVVETGTTRFECPSCKRHTGAFLFEFAPAEGTLVRTCSCGKQLFYLTQDGHMCANCGTYQAY